MKLNLIERDITQFEGDAIVNAANSSLIGGGGVDGAIHRAGGSEILEACKKIVDNQGTCPPGQAVITTAGKMKAKFVIHTVGPIWRGGNKNEASILAECYKNSLKLALQNHCKTIAFPNISTGVYGFPKAEAAKIAVSTVREFLKKTEDVISVTFVCFDEKNYNLTKMEIENS